MALGLRGEIRRLKKLLSNDRYTDIAVQFEAYDRDKKNNLHKTGDTSPVYGGCWDIWQQCYIREADSVLYLPCSIKQLEYILDDHAKTEGAGGRGGGKSEGGVLRAIRHIAEYPLQNGRILSPTYKLTKIVWGKLLSKVPREWLRTGKSGILRGEKELHFRNGVNVVFNSAVDPDSLRSWGGMWTLADEAQDITTESLDTCWFCLRETNNPRLWMTLTPKTGEAYCRHKEMMGDSEARCTEFSSYTNCFISKRVFDLAKSRMDKRRYAVEVEADWETIALLEEEEGPKYVFARDFSRSIHVLHWPLDWEDVTSKFVSTKFRYRGKKINYIIGVDPNWDYPNYAVIWKVYQKHKSTNGPKDPPTWVAIDVVKSKGHCGHLATRLKESGYGIDESVIIPDASAIYSKIRGKKTPVRMMRAEGYIVTYRKTNPSVTDSVDDVLAKLAPVIGDPSLYLISPNCDELAESFEYCYWGKDGKHIDKSQGIDHIIDAARYPISYFDPSAKIQLRRLQGRMAA